MSCERCKALKETLAKLEGELAALNERYDKVNEQVVTLETKLVKKELGL